MALKQATKPLDERSLVLGRKMGGRVTSLYADLFHRPKIGGTNQIAVFKDQS